MPIVTHEIGQYETFPNFDEIEKYTGSLKSRSMELYREWLDEKGLLELDKPYFAASGKLAAACYQEELEAVFRSEKLAGFQLLDLQDFSGQGTALVGMLDAFMDSKGILSDCEWRTFCSDAVLLAEFPDYVVLSEHDFSANLRLTTFRRESFDGKLLTWSLSDGNHLIAGSQLKICQAAGENYLHLGEISAKLPYTTQICKLELRIGIRETNVYKNYTLWLVPDSAKEQPHSDRIFTELNPAAEALLRAGKDVLLIRKPAEETSIEGTYCVDFWCYPMFKLISEMMNKPIPVGTMGLLIDNTHPALAQFTSEFYSTPQWWEIVTASRSEILDDNHAGKRFIVRTIDNFARNHWLGLIYEYDLHGAKVVVCNCDYEQLTQSPEGRQLIKSLLAYLNS